HYDTHDVIICQVHGSKRWQLFGAPLELPLAGQPHDKAGPEPTEPLQEFDLRDGDVPRLYDPVAGRVSIDGVDVRELSLATLTATVGVVTQDTFLYHASIAENLRAARPGATDAEL